MQPIYIYMLTYILPIFIFIALATYVLTHNNRAVENRFIFFTLIAFCITLLGEFLRHVSPISYNPYISMYSVGFSSTISMALILHLEVILIKHHCHVNVPRYLGYLSYLMVLAHAIMISTIVPLSSSDFYKSGIWVYRGDFLYNVWIYGVTGVMATSAFLICLYGWQNSATTHGKKLFRFLSVGTTIIFMTFLLAMLVLKVENMVPNPTLFLIFLTGILFALGITKFEMTPSIQARYQTMFNLTPTATMLLNERLEILEINDRAKTFFYDSEAGTLRTFLHTPPNVRQALRVIKKLRTEKVLHNFQTNFFHPLTNEKMTVLIEATLLPFQNDNQYYFMWHDITQELEKEKLIHHLAFHDSLTGIQNRAYFVSNVEKILRGDSQHALVLIDLNFFKQINDSYGHIVGDAVLQFVAKELQALVKDKGIVARLGGDEFVILYKNIESKAQVDLRLQKIRTHFSTKPCLYDDFNESISLSIGYSLYPKDGQNFEILFNIADMNMYDDKSKIKALLKKEVSEK